MAINKIIDRFVAIALDDRLKAVGVLISGILGESVGDFTKRVFGLDFLRRESNQFNIDIQSRFGRFFLN